MSSPLDSFMASLSGKCEDSLKRKLIHTSERFSASDAELKCEFTLPEERDKPPFSPLHAHTHTPSTLSNDVATMECETKCEGSLTLPAPPLQPGWLVVYRDRRGVLSGGCDDRQHGTVAECRWEENRWMVHLTDEQRLPLSFIRSVGQTNKAGEIVAAWTVREHGFDGQGPDESLSNSERK